MNELAHLKATYPKQIMIKRYSTLYAELKILEYQLKQKSKEAQGRRNAGFKITAGKRGFVKPEIFRDILGE